MRGGAEGQRKASEASLNARACWPAPPALHQPTRPGPHPPARRTAHYKLAQLVQYLPLPVIGGYLSFVGEPGSFGPRGRGLGGQHTRRQGGRRALACMLVAAVHAAWRACHCRCCWAWPCPPTPPPCRPPAHPTHSGYFCVASGIGLGVTQDIDTLSRQANPCCDECAVISHLCC